MAKQDDKSATNLERRPEEGFSRDPAAEQVSGNAARLSRELRQGLVERLAALRAPGETYGRVVNLLRSNAGHPQRTERGSTPPDRSHSSNICRRRGIRPS